MPLLYYKDSISQKHELKYEVNSYPNLMELIRDQGYEDWGDCRGRTWCGTCHIYISGIPNFSSIDIEEKARLFLMTNRVNNSRLACQILLDKNIDGLEIKYLGDD